jgi:dihydrolipoamide dehydrogenase
VKFDAVIIGSGIGGYPAAAYLADKGLKVAVIEEHLVGGECTNYGCVPTKALYHFAESARFIQRIGGRVEYSWANLVEWVKEIVRESREGHRVLAECARCHCNKG